MKSKKPIDVGKTDSRKLFLVGFMGAGKSTIGPLLAGEMGCPFIDLDERIEAQEGRSIVQIFAEKGEAYFRRRETQALKELAAEPAGVVALGGGCVTIPGNWDLIREQGVSVYLHCNVDLLVSRLIEDGSRPLLAGAVGGDVRFRIRTLLGERQSAYEQADLTIEVRAGDEPGDIVAKILKWMRSNA